MINKQNAFYIALNTKFNQELAEQEPPSFAKQKNDMSPDIAAMLIEAGVRSAKKLDRYCPITHIGTLYNSQYTHFVLKSDNTEWVSNTQNQKVYFFKEEKNLIKAFIDYYNTKIVSIVVGWETHTLWAIIINRLIKYRIPIADEIKQDPFVRYHTNKKLLSVANIYQQAVIPSMRNLPELEDVLIFWDINMPELGYSKLLTSEDLSNANIDDWMSDPFTRNASWQLVALEAVINIYYPDKENDDLLSYVSGSTREETRGPRPKHTDGLC